MGKARLQWTLRESYKVNNLLSRETRLHLNIQLSLLSQSMKDVLISIPITSLRFISITWAQSLEPANCSAKQCQWHFKGSQSVWWYSNVVRFWGDFRREHGELAALKSGNNDRTQVTPLATSTTTHPLPFFRVLAQGWNNFAQHGLGSPNSLTDASRGEGGWVGANFSSRLTFKFLSGQNLP